MTTKNTKRTDSPRSPGRPRAFDPDTALEAALRLFWTHGYEATSVAMLGQAMGLTPPQIYNAFVDKETLFRTAVQRYAEREALFAHDALGGPWGCREAIERLLEGAARAYTTSGKPRGCLFVTGALATSPSAEAVATELRARRKQTEGALTARLARGQGQGELAARVDVEGLGRYFTGVIHGMAIQARDGASTKELLAYARTAMQAWP